MLMQISSCCSLHSSTEQNMCQTKKNTKTTQERVIEEREREERRQGRDGRGTLFILACAIFANAEMSLFLEMF